MPNKPFLVTTPYPGFLDLNAEEFILLGDWCLNHKIKSILSGKKCEILDSPWTNDFITSSGKYSLDLAKYCLPHFTHILNNEHRIDMPHKYWKTLLSAWLINYIELIYVKYILISKAIETFGDLHIGYLNPEHYYTLNDINHFDALLYNDVYHLQLCSIIANEFGCDGFNLRYKKANDACSYGLKSSLRHSLFQKTVWKIIRPLLDKKVVAGLFNDSGKILDLFESD